MASKILAWGVNYTPSLLLGSIELYEKWDCLWNLTSKEYKNAPKKKAAKNNIGRHFGVTGLFDAVAFQRAEICTYSDLPSLPHLAGDSHI